MSIFKRFKYNFLLNKGRERNDRKHQAEYAGFSIGRSRKMATRAKYFK